VLYACCIGSGPLLAKLCTLPLPWAHHCEGPESDADEKFHDHRILEKELAPSDEMRRRRVLKAFVCRRFEACAYGRHGRSARAFALAQDLNCGKRA
jgi:hypothetical protein